MIYTSLTTPDYDTVLSLELIKQYLRIDPSDTSEDDLLLMLRDSAISFCEKYTSRVLVQTDFRLNTQMRIDDVIRIAKTPTTTISSVKQEGDDVDYTFNLGDYPYVRIEECNYLPGSYGPSINFSVEFTAGYTEDNFPAILKNALLSHIAYMYENRGDCCEGSIPKEILQKYSIGRVPVI